MWIVVNCFWAFSMNCYFKICNLVSRGWSLCTELPFWFPQSFSVVYVFIVCCASRFLEIILWRHRMIPCHFSLFVTPLRWVNYFIDILSNIIWNFLFFNDGDRLSWFSSFYAFLWIIRIRSLLWRFTLLILVNDITRNINKLMSTFLSLFEEIFSWDKQFQGYSRLDASLLSFSFIRLSSWFTQRNFDLN